MRLLVVAVLAAALACGRSSDTKPPPEIPPEAPLYHPAAPLPELERWMEITLACVTRSTIEHMDASAASYDVAAAALSTDRPRGHRHFGNWVAAFTAAVSAPRPASGRVTTEDLLGLAAVAHAELADWRTARELADRALATSGANRSAGGQRALEVLAWTRDGARATALAGDRVFDRAAVAAGLARTGYYTAARRLLWSLAPEAARADRAVRGVMVMALVYAGDFAAARALITAERAPADRALLYAWAADATKFSPHQRGRIGFLDDAIATVSAEAASATPDALFALDVWHELVKARDRIDLDRTARTRFHAWLLDPARAPRHLELIAFNVVRAEAAGMAADADRMLAMLPPAVRTRAELDLDLLRGNFDHALALLETHLAQRAALRAQDPGYAAGVVEGIDAVEVDFWLAYTDAPRAPAQIATFQKLVCR
jgi:hypothetical protein